MIWIKLRPLMMLFLLLLQGCGIYSFSGISLSPEVKTFSLKLQSEVALGPPNLIASFQQQLGDALVQRTSLKQVDTQGDLQLEGSIKKFSYTSLAPTKSIQDQTSIERLTIEVVLTYTNAYDKASEFDQKTFSQSADVTVKSDRSSEEARLIEAIFDALIADIFNETISRW
ncbi:MAG: LPS assembly lipoprotein LptE [Bacteroidota bacterium]